MPSFLNQRESTNLPLNIVVRNFRSKYVKVLYVFLLPLMVNKNILSPIYITSWCNLKIHLLLLPVSVCLVKWKNTFFFIFVLFFFLFSIILRICITNFRKNFFRINEPIFLGEHLRHLEASGSSSALVLVLVSKTLSYFPAILELRNSSYFKSMQNFPNT